MKLGNDAELPCFLRLARKSPSATSATILEPLKRGSTRSDVEEVVDGGDGVGVDDDDDDDNDDGISSNIDIFGQSLQGE